MEFGYIYPDGAVGEHMDLDRSQINILIALERMGATLSMIGVALICISYCCFTRLRCSTNLFIVFASIANIGASVACLIGYDGLEQGEDSALCKTQAFLLEMFMQSDAWWSFAMAFNVYLVFFHGIHPKSFGKYAWVYVMICFGIPFIPAIVCLVVKTETRGSVYGDATLWCWIGPNWNELRIFTYYVPIWFCIVSSTIIYIAVGFHVFRQRNQLRNLTFSQHAYEENQPSTLDIRDSAEKNLTGRSDIYGTAITEVRITMDSLETWSPPRSPIAPSLTTFPSPQKCPKTPPSGGCLQTNAWEIGDEDDLSAPTNNTMTGDAGLNKPQFQTTCVSEAPVRKTKFKDTVREQVANIKDKLHRLDPVKLAYLRTSFIFAISVLITWTPSSINRVHNLINKDEVSYGLNVASATVLPLQGLWNSIIFFSTSWRILREELVALMARNGLKSILPSHRAEGTSGNGALQRRNMCRDGGSGMEMPPFGTVRAFRGSF